MSANQQGYATLYGPNQPLLSPHYTGAELPGGDRGACLLQGQQPRPTAGLQANNALTANGQSNMAVTLPKATAPLVLTFQNIDVVAINIFAATGVNAYAPADDPTHSFPDTIDSLANSAPLVLAAGASVTLVGARGSWSTS